MRKMTSVKTNTIDVVVVDPLPEDYRDFAATCGRDDFELRWALTAREALGLRPRSLRSVWFVNVDLPDLSGFELCEVLRERHQGALVYLVGNTYRPEDEMQARIVGAPVYACKPPLVDWLTHSREAVSY